VHGFTWWLPENLKVPLVAIAEARLPALGTLYAAIG
jgi:hypothetical protein